jgi:hypothetical protein
VKSSPPKLYNTLSSRLEGLGWQDKRHLQTFVWIVLGLIESSVINLTQWVPFVQSRATFAQSTVRRFSRFLANRRIRVSHLYGALIKKALANWGENVLYVALDTSLLWNRFCLIRLSVIYRGRAVPLLWLVLKHKSASVKFNKYRPLLARAVNLMPADCKIVLLADRGFVCLDLMRYIKTLSNWHFRNRGKKSLNTYRLSKRGGFCRQKICAGSGSARFYHNIYLSDEYFGEVHIAFARLKGSREYWYIISDEPVEEKTFDEYGLRFMIEENFLDDKSNGFQLESSLIRSASVLNRLCFALAVATLFLTAQGEKVVESGKRRYVDPHWFRELSYLKIGWEWVKSATARGFRLISHIRLSGHSDSEPVKPYKNYIKPLPSAKNFVCDFCILLSAETTL